jgi:ParB-like chromosome segregation protein Spo0J
MPATLKAPLHTRLIAITDLKPSAFSESLYGDSAADVGDLLTSIQGEGLLVPLVVSPLVAGWEVISGHRRLACARALGWPEVPCEIRTFSSKAARQRAVLEYNRQRTKTFSQRMREADALEALHARGAQERRRANLIQFQATETESRNSDDRRGRTDDRVARALGIGGKDLYRQARAVWKAAQEGDARARSSVRQLDAGTKTIHAAHKDLRRRDKFTAGFRPTPYDVWAFKHDRAFGIPHPGSIPPAIIAHLLHYFTRPGALVVDPMAGGGTTVDVCVSMGRRCAAYDLCPVRPEIRAHDVRQGLPAETTGCDLVFYDPPYHTMLARRYESQGAGDSPLADWIAFLHELARHAYQALRPGGYVALLVANQTEKDLPAGYGYIDHAFYGFQALAGAGFLPQRRVSCPMDGAYLPQHVRDARRDGRMLGQVRDLLIMRKPPEPNGSGQTVGTGQFVDLTAHERVGEGRVPADDGLGQ